MVENACADLARAAEQIAAAETDPRAFLERLGHEVAGIHSGPRAVLDLIVSGRTELPGGGFRPELRDHSGSQTRHFAGVARAVTVLGPRRTVWISEHLRRDRRGSADGRLTLLAVEFASGLMDGSIDPDEGGAWIRQHLCGP